MEKTRAVTVARNAKNDDKNRFRNILPYDYNRVQLKGEAGNDYINASYITDDQGNRKYIATQGPLPNTIDHFWEMIWETQASTIVMMTALVEGGKTKCEHYWPTGQKPHLHGNVTVTLVGSKQTEDFIQRTLLIGKEGKELTVTHYQYLAWTDHGVPASTAPLVGLLYQVKMTSQEDEAPTGPIVVHCSAGIGRTGTFIAADMLMNAIQQSTAADYIDVAGTVAKLREQRTSLVQTLYQYIYLHRVVLSLIEE